MNNNKKDGGGGTNNDRDSASDNGQTDDNIKTYVKQSFGGLDGTEVSFQTREGHPCQGQGEGYGQRCRWLTEKCVISGESNFGFGFGCFSLVYALFG